MALHHVQVINNPPGTISSPHDKRIEKTPQEFKLATKSTKNQVQAKSMCTITKHTKKATEP